MQKVFQESFVDYLFIYFVSSMHLKSKVLISNFVSFVMWSKCTKEMETLTSKFYKLLENEQNVNSKF